jgi:Family of unknown function (DUF5694)
MDTRQKFIMEIQEYTAAETVDLAHTRLSTFLRDRNSDAADQLMKKLYNQDILAYGSPENEVGVELTTAWYKSNSMTLNNISRTIDSPKDRILVIVGAAHRAMIKDFILTRDDLEYLEINDYLIRCFLKIDISLIFSILEGYCYPIPLELIYFISFFEWW